MSNRSKKFIFVPFCLMAQAYQAQGIVKYEWKSSIKPIMKLLLDNDINIVQMPCTEATFNDSLIRKPKGLSKYNTKEFNEHCQEKADKVISDIKNIIKCGYEVIGILGIEQSPSCCVNYIYTNKGNEKRKGLFIEKIYEGLREYDIPIIGINRKYVRKSLKELEKVIDKALISS